MLSYKQKLEQANREARATVVALVALVFVWLACGFGLASFDAQVFHTPLWVVGGTLGTWLCAIIVTVVLARCVFADFALEDEGGEGGAAEDGEDGEGGAAEDARAVVNCEGASHE